MTSTTTTPRWLTITLWCVVAFLVVGTLLGQHVKRQARQQQERATDGKCYLVGWRTPGGDSQLTSAKEVLRLSETRLELRDITKYGKVTHAGPVEVTSASMVVREGKCL